MRLGLYEHQFYFPIRSSSSRFAVVSEAEGAGQGTAAGARLFIPVTSRPSATAERLQCAERPSSRGFAR